MVSSINTNIAAYYAQANIGKASSSASSSISRLSSGNRIVQAKDDVAALAAGTGLRTNVTTLRRALINASQGSSLLQVADGALSQVTDILQRQKAIAVQASGGTLTDNDRGFLNQEFQNLTSEIDRLAKQTNFNGVNLLNGALSETVAADSTSAIADRAVSSITFGQNIAAASTLQLNTVNVAFVAAPAAGSVTVGATIQDTLDNLVTFLNSSTNSLLSGATYKRDGAALVITAKAAGTGGENYVINDNLAVSTALAQGGTATNARIGSVTAQYDRKITSVISGLTAANTTVDATNNSAGTFTAGIITGQNNLNASVTLYTVTATDSIQNVVDGINTNTGTTGVKARISGSSGAYSIVLERNYNFAAGVVNEALSALTAGGAALATVTAGPDVKHNLAALDGSTNVGLGAGRTSVTGTVGNSLVTGLSQSTSKVTVSFPDIADSDLLTTANFGTARSFTFTTSAGAVTFGFVNQTPVSDNEVKVGATLSETLDNFAAAYNKYQGYAGTDYSFKQTTARREGNNIIIEGNQAGKVNDVDATPFVLTSSPAIAGVGTVGDFQNGSNTGGVDVTGVTNANFIGKVGGFAATYTGTNDTVNLSVKIGANTYTASTVDTTPTAATNLVRFTSQDGGGFFDVYLGQNQGTTTTSQANADTFADRLNAAFASLNFSQNRNVSSYNGDAPIVTNGSVTGSLIGTSVNLKTADFTDVKIDKINVTAPTGSNPNGNITITINGEDFTTAANLGSKLGNNSSFKLTSTQDANKVITFKTGDTVIDFSSKEKADAFESALKTAFGVGDGSADLVFQVGTTSKDTLAVSIGNIDTNSLFKGNSVDVLTQAHALSASDAIDVALQQVTAVRANVGALQSRFDFASANIESSIQNQDAARGTLLDTDVAGESTAYATAQVQLQAGISVLAQANQLPQNLLKLIG